MAYKHLPTGAIKRNADFARTAHHVTIEHGMATVEDVLRPNFWVHHVARLHRHDVIDIVAEDGSFDLTARVVDKGIGFVNLRVLRIWQAEVAASETADETPVAEVPEGYIVNHAPRTGWRVLMNEPRIEVARNFKSKAEAVQAAIEHAARATGQAA